MKWKIRHYGKSYIYDKLHRGAVTVMMGLSVLGLVQVGLIVAPIIKKHVVGPKNGEILQTAVENKSPS